MTAASTVCLQHLHTTIRALQHVVSRAGTVEDEVLPQLLSLLKAFMCRDLLVPGVHDDR